MPSIITLGSASARGFGFGAGGSKFTPFALYLDASDRSRYGDSDSVINAWWAGYTSPLLTSKGKQTYDGYYAFTLGQNARLTATLGGAAGWGNNNGRYLQAVFNLSAETRLVFFAGKATNKTVTGQTQGAGGGASVLMTWNGSSFTPLIVAAGGSAGFNQRASALTARALSLTSSVSSSPRFSLFSGQAGSLGAGGVGRGSQYSAQSAGAGFYTRAYTADQTSFSIDQSGPEALNAGALGGQNSGAAGGFGGGGGDFEGNSYGAGGGGFYGGWETNQGTEGDYTSYTSKYSETADNHLGPLSYVNPIAVEAYDLGLHGITSGSNVNSDQTGGSVTLYFTPL